MPETTMHEDDLSPTRKDEIGLSEHRNDVQTIPVAHRMDNLSDNQLGT